MSFSIHYITHWYAEKHPMRRCELAKTIGLQLCDPCVSSVCLLTEPERPSFGDLVRRGKSNEGVVNLLTNTDCYIDPADTPLLEQAKPGEIWCLSRVDNCRCCSQDAWAWRGTLSLPRATYTQGILGCDNRFAYDCAVTGRTPINPALSVHLYHVHESKHRTYDEQSRLPRPYLYVQPVALGEPTQVMLQGGSPAERGRVEYLHQYYRDLRV
jgi:hypothetical protein